MKRKLLIIVICFMSLFSLLIACDPPQYYKGEHKDLFTVAVNSLLGVNGFTVVYGNGPEVEIIEEDDYGRKLFSYLEKNVNISSLLISQKSDDSYVYYYEDYNFIAQHETSKNALNDFTELEIEELKNFNDWNKPLNEEKFVKEKIVNKKKQPRLNRNKENILKKLYSGIIGTSDKYNGAICLTSDNDGRMIFFVVSNYNKNDKDYSPYVVIIINSDWSYKEDGYGMEVKDLYNYQSDLKLLKELNNWNK